jgi:transposase-like protein
MSTVLRISTQGKSQAVCSGPPSTVGGYGDLDTRIALIQALIPLGLQAVEDVLQQEVQTLAGPRYARGDATPHRVRWGRQRGSVYLADQKLPIQVPRVRDRHAGIEIPLQSYTQLQQPRAADDGLLRRVLYGLSCRDYRTAAEAVPEAFGLSRSSVSRRYIRATARKLTALQERRLERYDVVAMVLDGKRFADDTLVIALGITLRGEKVVLGFVQTGTENATACTAFLRHLLDRGLQVTDGLLVVLDGGKGLRRAVREVLGAHTPVQRCTWHKRENIIAYLPKHLQAPWRAKLQTAYRQPTYAAAQAMLTRLHGELRRLNEDAARSLAEGLEETLTLHRLGLADRLGAHLATTNGLESVLALVEHRVGKVDRWTTSNQKQRWLATVLLELEPRLRRLRGYRALPALRTALKQNLTKGEEVMVA